LSGARADEAEVSAARLFRLSIMRKGQLVQGNISKQEAPHSGLVKMYIGTRLRELRRQKGLSQADIQEKTGVHRCYISRIEHGPTVPSLETLEKFAAALDVPLYRIFYEGQEPPPAPRFISSSSLEDPLATASGRESQAGFLQELRDLWDRMGDHERGVLINIAKRLAAREEQTAAERAQVDRPPGAGHEQFQQRKGRGECHPRQRAGTGKTN